MATYSEIYNLRHESISLRNRAEVAVVTAAQNVLNEDPGVTNHANRALWSHWALKNSKKAAGQMMWGLVGNATIQSNGDASTDADIQFVIDGLIDSFADGSH